MTGTGPGFGEPGGARSDSGGSVWGDPGTDAGFAYDSDGSLGQDSWQEARRPEHTHDPHEVTIQLDGVGQQLEDWLVQQAKGAPSAQEPSDGPVFVDETGRRSRRYRRIGMAVGLACAVYAVVILATLLSGNSSAPWLPVPGQDENKPAGKVDTPSLPADSVDPSGTVSPSPGESPSAGGEITGTPEASGSADPSASVSGTGKTSDPKPSQTSTKPGSNPKPSNDPEPTDSEPATPDPDPTETATVDPSDPPAAGGTDTVAGAQHTPAPIAGTPDAEAPASEPAPLTVALASSSLQHSPSPENIL
ncbi:hypothetical protein [Streptomyces fructofermentans]|nr:hypothetical protein [Streptomyces fructofermentans]